MFNYIKSGKHIFCVNNDLSVVLCFHNMVVDVKLCRFQDVPWGFRLTGGADFDVPLTVVKVSCAQLGMFFFIPSHHNMRTYRQI